MGEEQKKTEEKKTEEKPKEEKKTEDSKAPPPPPPLQEIVLRVFMHCEGCARKIKRYLKSLEGVEEVQTDCKTHKVVVKGAKADPLKVVERVKRKSHREVELLSPIPKPPPPPLEEAKKIEVKEPPKSQEKKEEPPQVMIVVLKVYMHCEACAQQLKRRIQKMQGVENAEPDLKNSLVTVKGVLDPPKLVEYVYKRTGKKAVVVKQEPVKKKEEQKPKEEGGNKPEEKKDGGEAPKEAPAAVPAPAVAVPAPAVAVPAAAEGETKVVEMTKNELMHYYYPGDNQIYPPKYATEMYTSSYPYPPPHAPQMATSSYPYPPPHGPQMATSSYSYPPPLAHDAQMFSDENPNACFVM